MITSPTRCRSAAVVLAMLPLADAAFGGDVVLEAVSTVVTPGASASSPFAGVIAGDPVLVHFEVFVPGMDVVPGQLTNFAIDPTASYVQIGGIVDSLVGSNVAIQNDFPVADGIRVFGSPAAGGGSVTLELGESSGTLFSSTDVAMQLGSWDSTTWSSFSFMLAGGGSFIEFDIPDVSIFLPTVGTSYCGPAQLNSTGASAAITASGSASLALNDPTLTTTGLPANTFGYYLGSQIQGFTMNPGGSQGDLCLANPVGRFVTQIQNSGAAGAFSITVDLSQIPQPTGLVPGQVGEQWNFQTWYRDANPSTTSNFSDGLAVTLE